MHKKEDTKSISLIISERLAELQENEDINKKDLSDRQLAKDIGVSPNTIGAYKRMENLPTADILCKIAQYFNVSTDYLLGLSNYKQRDKALESLKIPPKTTEAIIKFHKKVNEEFKDNKIKDFINVFFDYLIPALLSNKGIFYIYYAFFDEIFSDLTHFNYEQLSNAEIYKELVLNRPVHKTDPDKLIKDIGNNFLIILAGFIPGLINEFYNYVSYDYLKKEKEYLLDDVFTTLALFTCDNKLSKEDEKKINDIYKYIEHLKQVRLKTGETKKNE